MLSTNEEDLRRGMARVAGQARKKATRRKRKEAGDRRLILDNSGLDPNMWGSVKRMARKGGHDIHAMPLEGKALLNPAEALSLVYRDRNRLPGARLRIKADPVRLQQMRRYLQNLLCTPTHKSSGYITRDHMQMVASGKAGGRDFVSRQGAVHIDITGYTSLPQGELDRLARTLEAPSVKATQGKQGQVALLLKDGRKPMSSSNARGITIPSHLSKVEPTAYYNMREPGIYERVLGGPYVVGGVKGVSIVEVVRVALMTIDMAKMEGVRLEILITDLSRLIDVIDVIPQDMHPIVGAWVGLGTYEELRSHTEGYSYILPLRDL